MKRSLLLLSLLSLSCGSSELVTAEQGCTDFAAAYCGRLNACVPPYIRLPYGDEATCRSRVAASCPQALRAPQTTLTPTKLVACSQALKDQSCADLYERRAPAACVPDPGPIVAGMACGEDGQCQSTYCKKAPNATCGVCAAREATDGACARNEDCLEGLACGANRKCAPLGHSDASCDGDHPCAPPLVCKEGRCAAASVMGDPCQPNAQDCDPIAPLFCKVTAPATASCQPVLYAAVDQACGVVDGNLVYCQGSAICDARPRGVCKAPAADGAACDPQMSLGCLAPATCINGACALPNPAACQ